MKTKWLKKSAVGLLAAALLLTTTGPVLADDDETPELKPYVLLQGEVKEVEEARILFTADEDSVMSGDVYLAITEDTVIIDAATGETAPAEDLEEGMILSVYAASVMALSYPAQGSAFFLLMNTPEDYQVPSYEDLMAQYKPANTLRVWGTVTRQENGQLLLENQSTAEAYNKVSLILDEETLILDATTGMPVTDEAIADSDVLYAWVSPAMTRSAIPQTRALLVLCKIPADYAVPQYHEVKRAILDQDGGMLSITTDGSEQITLTEDVELEPWMTDNLITLSGVTVDCGILVWRGAESEIAKVMVFPEALSLRLAQPAQEPTQPEPAEPVPVEPEPVEPTQPPVATEPEAPVQPEEGKLKIDEARADALWAELNAAREKAGKNALSLGTVLTQVAAEYAESMFEAGADFYKTTDFSAMPDGSSVYSLLSAADYKNPISNFGYSVWRNTFSVGDEAFDKHIGYVQSTNLYSQRAINGDYSRIGIACVTTTDGVTPYTVVIMVYHK